MVDDFNGIKNSMGIKVSGDEYGLQIWSYEPPDGREQENLYDEVGLRAGSRRDGKNPRFCSIMMKSSQSVMEITCR